MTDRAFPGCGWIEIFARFHNFIVAPRAVAMKGLLVGQGDQLSSDFKLDLRNFGQELWFGVSSSMTIATDIYFGCSWVFLEQVRRQCSGPIRRPHCFQRRMLRSFGSRLRGMMTFNARYPGALNAAILGDMVDVAELNNS
jgi:hypothetical protein